MYKQYTSKEANNPNFWSDHWNSQNMENKMESAKYGELIPLFKKYLLKEGRILEAGCGQGIFVNALKELGYDIEGIDFDEKTVEKINKNFPELNIKIGDVFNLKYPDNYFSGYVSLGVIEHYEKDWKEPIKEARRVLNSGGILFLAVPHFNYLRRVINFFGYFFHKPSGQFYQYFFKPSEIRKVVKSERFKIIAVDFYGKSKTLMGLPFLGKILKKQYDTVKSLDDKKENKTKKNGGVKNSLKKFIFKLLPNGWFAHMVLIIGKKDD